MENINALDEIHKGACMGIDAINIILDIVEDESLIKELNDELNDYRITAEKIEKIYPKYDEGSPHGTSGVNKAMTWSTIEMKTMNDKSNSKIAEILLNGINMGIIEGTRILNNKKTNEEVTKIVEEYVAMQEKNLDNVKKYL